MNQAMVMLLADQVWVEMTVVVLFIGKVLLQ